MDLVHAQSTDPTATRVRPAQRPFAVRKTTSADRIIEGVARALKASEWLEAEGFETLALNVTTFRAPEIQVVGNARALTLVATGAAQEVRRRRGDQGEFVHYEYQRHGVCVVFVIEGVPA